MTIEVSSLLLTSVVVSLDHAVLYRGDENERKFSWFQMMQFLDSVVLYRGDENERKFSWFLMMQFLNYYCHNGRAAALHTVTCTISLVPPTLVKSCTWIEYSLYNNTKTLKVLVSEVCLLSFTTATHKHRSLGGGALQGYHGWRGTMENSCNNKHILSVTANAPFIIQLLHDACTSLHDTIECLQWLNSPSMIPSKLSPDHPAPHVVQSCFSIRDVRDWLITP